METVYRQRENGIPLEWKRYTSVGRRGREAACAPLRRQEGRAPRADAGRLACLPPASVPVGARARFSSFARPYI